MSAEQGNARGQYNLGLMYYNGEGVPQDYKKAVKWYRKSAEQGHAMAQSNLGLMYMSGTRLPQDYITGYAWISVAKANGYVTAVTPLDMLRKYMFKDKIAEGQKLARELSKRIEPNRKD
jgi:TPR repeat protein